MTQKKIKKYLYYDDERDRYRLHYGTTITLQDKKEIMKIYKKLEKINWLPSKAIPLLNKYKQSETKPHLIKTYKGHLGRINLYVKGFYIQSGTIQDIKEAIQDYLQTNYDNKWIDKKRAKIKTYEKTTPKHIMYIPSSGKYRITKSINGLCHYFGTYDNLPRAELEVKKLEENNWKITRERKKYNKDKRDKYITKQTHGNHYAIVKQGEHYGTYRTLQDAREERDWLVKNNWNYENIDLY